MSPTTTATARLQRPRAIGAAAGVVEACATAELTRKKVRIEAPWTLSGNTAADLRLLYVQVGKCSTLADRLLSDYVLAAVDSAEP